MINDLMDACAQGKGREKTGETFRYLQDYVNKHFGDEERLQQSSQYPGYAAHRTFHEGYKRKLGDAAAAMLAEGATVKSLGSLNQIVGVLVSHIRTDDKKLAQFLQGK